MYKRQIATILTLDGQTPFRGVYPMDRLPKRQPGAYVINMDNHDEPGSHWVAVYDDKKNVEYMDSYGFPPLDQRCLQFVRLNFSYNSLPLQKPLSNACGFYCVYYILQRSRNVSADDIGEFLASLSSSSGTGSQSDFYVKDFIYSQFKPVFN